MKLLPPLTCLLLGFSSVGTTASLAQGVGASLERIDQLEQQAPARQRAMNLARNTAITLNGGLSVYVPAACMFSSGGSGDSCLVENNSSGFLFRFHGGAPGWQQLGKPPSCTTEIVISPDGRTVTADRLQRPRRLNQAAQGLSAQLRSQLQRSRRQRLRAMPFSP